MTETLDTIEKGLTWWLKTSSDMSPGSQWATYRRLGKMFSSVPLGTQDAEELGRLLAGIHAFRVGECYMNAVKIAMKQKSLIFCEGIASGLWPVEHAWVSYKGRAIDVTWPLTWEKGRGDNCARYRGSQKAELIMKRVVNNLATCRYYGLEIPTGIISAHCFEYKRYTPMFDPHYARHWAAYEKQILSRKEPS